MPGSKIIDSSPSPNHHHQHKGSRFTMKSPNFNWDSIGRNLRRCSLDVLHLRRQTSAGSNDRRRHIMDEGSKNRRFSKNSLYSIASDHKGLNLISCKKKASDLFFLKFLNDETVLLLDKRYFRIGRILFNE
uniref:Uncharacterized protein n=1 Tax=Romanomermis culicivorax TaxID=13658 RepID=A0A915HKX8_ROMCU